MAGLVHLMLFFVQTLAGKTCLLSSLAASTLLLHLPAPINTVLTVGRSQAISILAQLALLHSGVSPAEWLPLFSSLMDFTVPQPQAVTKAAKPDHQV